MKIEELISTIAFRVSGLNDLRAAEKAMASLKKSVAESTKSMQRGFANNLGRDAQKFTKQLRDAAAAARQAKADFVSIGGGRSWVQAELDRLRQLQRVQRQVGQEARRQQAEGRRAPRAAPVAQHDVDQPPPPRRERRRRDRGQRAAVNADPLHPEKPEKRQLVHVPRGDARTATRSALRASADNARETVRQQMAGMTAEEIKTLRLKAIDLSGQYPSADVTSIREMGRGLRNMLPGFDDAMRALPQFTKGFVALQSARGIEHARDQNEAFFRTQDIIGNTEDPTRLGKLYESFMRASAVEGRQLNAREYVNMARRSKSAAPALSDAFLESVAPTFMQDLGGNALGVALDKTLSQLVGDRATSASKDYQRKIGLRNNDGIVGRDLLLSDPDIWTNQYLRPALAKQGVDVNNVGAVTAELAKIFSADTPRGLFSKLITQAPQIERNRKLYAGAMGTEAADLARQKDPYVALEGLYGAARNLAGVATEGHVEKATSALNSLADAISGFTKRLADDPEAANLSGSIGLGAGAAAVGGLAWLKWKMLKGVANLFGGKTPAVPIPEPAAPTGPASPSSAGAPKPAGAPGGGFLRGAGGLLRGGILTALYEGGKLAIDAGLNALNRKIGIDPSKNKVDDSFTGTLGRLSEDVKRGLAFLGNPIRGGGKGQSVIDDAALERSRRAQEDFRRDPEGARGRAMSAREAVMKAYNPEQAQKLVTAIENFTSGAWMDRITAGAQSALSASSAMAAGKSSGGGGTGQGSQLNAPISITNSPSFSGIMDAAAVAKMKSLIDQGISDAMSKLSAKLTKAANTSTGNITGP